MKFISSILILTLSGCFNEKTFIQQDSSSNLKNNELHYDGIYCKVDTSKGYDGVPLNIRVAHVHPLRFFENNFFASSFYSYHNDQELQKYFKEHCYTKDKQLNEGFYYIKNDSIHMIGKFSFYWIGKISKYYIAHFRGYIKNADTITDWKMIPPYPNIDFEGNFYKLNRNQPATYIFKPLKFDSIIDPNKLWIIKEQKRQNKSK